MIGLECNDLCYSSLMYLLALIGDYEEVKMYFDFEKFKIMPEKVYPLFGSAQKAKH